MAKKYYSLVVFVEGNAQYFTVDEPTLHSFENAFTTQKDIIQFVDKDDDSTVKFKSDSLSGYKKVIKNPIPQELANE